MADLIILEVPEDIAVRARQIAATVAQPVEQLLLDHLKMLVAPLPVRPFLFLANFPTDSARVERARSRMLPGRTSLSAANRRQ